MRILMTNDDGIDAEGLAVMARAVSRWIDQAPSDLPRSAVIAAPHRNYSGMSSAVGDVFDAPYVDYRRRTIDGAENIAAFELECPPALCAIVGSLGAFGWRPDVVLSGINPGANVGRSVLHSGTVGAVLTAAQLGISGLAVSVQWGDHVHYETAAALALEVLDELFTAPQVTTLNLNVPNVPREEVRGVRRARISTAVVVEDAAVSHDGDLPAQGRVALTLGAASPTIGDVSDEQDDDDGALVEAGFAALTALRGPQENSDPSLDSLLRAALARVSAHLDQAR